MSLKKFATPLRIPLKASIKFSLLLLTLHIAMAVSVLLVAIPIWLKALLMLILIGSAWLVIRQHGLRNANGAIVQAIWSDENEWQLQYRNGEVLDAQLKDDFFIHPSWVILRFNVDGLRFPTSLVITTDALNQISFRLLKIRLKLLPQTSDQV